MFWLSEQLRNTGDPVDLERAQIIENMLERRGTDIPLPDSLDNPNTEVMGNTGNLALKYLDVCLLRDSGNDVLISDVGQQVSRIESVTEVKAQAETVLSPYNTIFRSHIPPHESPSSPKRFGRTRTEVPNPKAKQTCWDYQLKKDGTSVDFRYWVDYWQSNTQDQIRSVSIRFDSQLDSGVQDSLKLKFKDEKIQEVQLEWGHATPHTLLKLAGNSFLAQFINKFFVTGNHSSDVSVLRLSISGNEPQLAISQDFTKYMHAPTRDIKTGSSFNLGDAGDEFTRSFVNLDANKEVAEKAGVSLEDSLSIAD